MILLKVLHWDLTQASDSCSPLLWQTQGHDGQQPRQPPHLPRVSWAHTALRHSTGNKTNRSSSGFCSSQWKPNRSFPLGWTLHEGQTHKVSRPAGHPVLPRDMTEMQRKRPRSRNSELESCFPTCAWVNGCTDYIKFELRFGPLFRVENMSKRRKTSNKQEQRTQR